MSDVATKTVYEVKTSFTIYANFKVPADSFDEALDKLCNKELLTEYCGDPATWGFDERKLEEEGITVEIDSVDGDPSPTGRACVVSDWEFRGFEVDENGDEIEEDE